MGMEVLAELLLALLWIWALSSLGVERTARADARRAARLSSQPPDVSPPPGCGTLPAR
jgi:hypothetical protein